MITCESQVIIIVEKGSVVLKVKCWTRSLDGGSITSYKLCQKLWCHLHRSPPLSMESTAPTCYSTGDVTSIESKLCHKLWCHLHWEHGSNILLSRLSHFQRAKATLWQALQACLLLTDSNNHTGWCLSHVAHAWYHTKTSCARAALHLFLSDLRCSVYWGLITVTDWLVYTDFTQHTYTYWTGTSTRLWPAPSTYRNNKVRHPNCCALPI